MKKIIFLIVFLFVSLSLLAQDWQTVVSTRLACFEFNLPYTSSLKELRLINIDSISTNGNDSIFFNYHSKKEGQFIQCYQLNDTGWIGSSIIIRENGDNIFFNQLNDSIVIKAFANAGDSWRLFELGGGNYLEAAITSTQIESVLGSIDSTKTIVMNAKDNLGQPISHLMSNRVIKISKQHGIITPCRFNNFPDDTTQFKLSGRTLLTQRDIFNFNVGDFFQWDGTQRSGVANFVHTYEQTQVFSKDSSADSIKYVIDYTYYRITHILPNTYYLYGHDTDTIVYAFNQPSTLDLIPNKFYSLGLGNSYGVDEQLSDSAYYHDRSMKQESKYYVYDAFQNCISEGIFDCGFWDYFYAEGLGIVRIFDYTQFPFCYDYQMVYYNKGSETWGTPLNWSLILSANEIGKNDFKIFPNPFNDVLNIEFPDFKNDPSKIEITDVNGRLVKSLDSEEQQDLKIFTGDMKPGFYLLKIELGNNSFHYKLLKN